ncbi:MAG: S8 family serine peptidase [Anaerolineae bacterium]|nr:S8 family serine peptidase [Anaerolineae bacterium]
MERKVLLVLFALGILLVAAAGAVFVISLCLRQEKPDVALPPSLDELADLYPDLAQALGDPELDTVYKEFLLVYEEEGEDAALEMARERGILVTNEGQEYVRLTLILDTEDSAALQAQLEEIGVIVTSAFQDQVDVAVPLALIQRALASDDPGAVFSDLAEMEHVIAVRLPRPRASDGSAIDGEGVETIDADAWHDAGITGAGVRIGVLDLGFEGYEDLLGEELPDDVVIKEFGWYFDEMVVHGTACAEIVHEVAPGAELVFALYDGSDSAFGRAVEWLVDQDVDVVSHSAGGLVGPRDGSEWDAKLVDELAAEGILWVNAAGNEALSHHRSTFSDTDGDGIHEFGPDEEVMAIYSYSGFLVVALSWDDDWEQPMQDYQLFLYDRAGGVIASSQDVQSGKIGQEPVEMVFVEEDVVYAAVVVEDADRDVTFDIFVMDGDVEYPTAGYSISPPSDAQYSLTVGAVEWWDEGLAEYSSQGPTSDGRLKPEISAPTGVSGVTYGSRGFDGTSASCPHVAGAAALVWQAHPEFTRQDTVDFLLSHTLDLGPGGPDTGYGYGLLQLPESPGVEIVITPTPVVPPTPPEPTLTELAPTLTGTPGLTATPRPTPTPPDYTIPTLVPPSSSARGGADTGTVVFAGGVAVLLLGCGGAVLLLVGGVGLLVLRRRDRRAPSHPATEPRLGQKGGALPAAAPQLPQDARCQYCGAGVRPGARFCPVCGQPRVPTLLVRHCPHCGAILRDGARFCAKCGQPAE